MTRLGLLTVLLPLRALLKSKRYEEALKIIDEIIAEARRTEK